MQQAVAQDENFFKHADRDPDALLNFKPITTTFFLMDAVSSYEALTGERPPILRTFQMWMMIQNSDLVKEEFRNDWTARLKVAGPDPKRMSKQEFFTQYLSAIAKNESS